MQGLGARGVNAEILVNAVGHGKGWQARVYGAAAWGCLQGTHWGTLGREQGQGSSAPRMRFPVPLSVLSVCRR